MVSTANTQPLPDFDVTVCHVMSKRSACSVEVKPDDRVIGHQCRVSWIRPRSTAREKMDQQESKEANENILVSEVLESASVV
jgi:hypothetical protein